ncbi:MAG TPA: hypothetical protein VFN21_05630, partial [Acidimicrobiales bacterium]|nr:hypothetical protein [Acidimicrobiales bacterium]
MPVINSRARLLSATALACGSVTFVGGMAQAQNCVTNPPAGTNSVNCSGTTTTGESITVNVTSYMGGSVNFNGNTATKGLVSTAQISGGVTADPNSGSVSFDNSAYTPSMVVTGTGTSTVTNRASGTINGTLSLEGVTNTVDNSGRIGTLALSGGGTNTVTNAAGGTIQSAGMTGADNTLENLGNINGSVTLKGGESLLQNVSKIGGAVTMTGDGGNTLNNFVEGEIGLPLPELSGKATITGNGPNKVDNSGRMNGLAITGDGTNVVVNRAGAEIDSTFTITSYGTATPYNNEIFNAGLLPNGFFSIGSAIDGFVNWGEIRGNASLGGGDDAFFMYRGKVTNDVDMGTGDDYALVTAGSVNRFLGQAGDDRLTWSGGMINSLDMGPGSDLAVMDGLALPGSGSDTDFNMDGGSGGPDRMTWTGTTGSAVYRIRNWEYIDLTNGSRLDLDGNLSLTGDGVAAPHLPQLSIDAASTLRAWGNSYSIGPGAGASIVAVANDGLIDLADGNATRSLTVRGRYFGGDDAGHAGKLKIDAYLGDERAEGKADQLVIENGWGYGSTLLDVAVVGDSGDPTFEEGIRVVWADSKGSLTSPGAFGLEEGSIEGNGVLGTVYYYGLFRGALTEGKADNDWFLRVTDDDGDGDADGDS